MLRNTLLTVKFRMFMKLWEKGEKESQLDMVTIMFSQESIVYYGIWSTKIDTKHKKYNISKFFSATLKLHIDSYVL